MVCVQFTAENGARIKWKLNILIFILLQLHAGCCILMKLGNYVKWALTWKGNVFVICWWMFLKTTAILVNINRYPHLNLTTDYISVFETLHWKTLSTIMISIKWKPTYNWSGSCQQLAIYTAHVTLCMQICQLLCINIHLFHNYLMSTVFGETCFHY